MNSSLRPDQNGPNRHGGIHFFNYYVRYTHSIPGRNRSRAADCLSVQGDPKMTTSSVTQRADVAARVAFEPEQAFGKLGEFLLRQLQ